jgi:hypothetical protein
MATIRVFEQYPFYRPYWKSAYKILFNEDFKEILRDDSSIRSLIRKYKDEGISLFFTLYDKWFLYASFDQPNFKPRPVDREFWPGEEEYDRVIYRIFKACEENGISYGCEAFRTMDLSVPFTRKNPAESGGFWSFGESSINVDGSFEIECPNPGRMESNPGESDLRFEKVKYVFAFKEESVKSNDFYRWKVTEVRNVTEEVLLKEIKTDDERKVVKIKGLWKNGDPRWNIYAIVELKAQEFDYARDEGLTWVKKLIDKYDEMGVRLKAFYEDEPHIWWDWGNWKKYGEGINLPDMIYVTDALAEVFYRTYNISLEDKIFIFFPRRKDGKAEGRFLETVEKTLLIKAYYFELLEDLYLRYIAEIRDYAEKKWGEIECIGHNTWCNTIGDDCAQREIRVGSFDSWKFRRRFWKNGGRSDFGESGHIELDYYGFALATSFSKGGKPEWGYYGYWSLNEIGKKLRESIADIEASFGLESEFTWILKPVQGMATRKTTLLSIFPKYFPYYYPMHQWYSALYITDYVTDEEFSEYAKIEHNKIEINNYTYDTLIVQFVPIIFKRSFEKIKEFLLNGGTVIFIGPPVLLYHDGTSAKRDFESLLGIKTIDTMLECNDARGEKIEFMGALSGIGEYNVEDCSRCHYWIDKTGVGFLQELPSEATKEVGYRSLVYPFEVEQSSESEKVAKIDDKLVGVLRKINEKGICIYLAFCPPVDAIERILVQLGKLSVYQKISRETDYLVHEFPNGSITLTRHLKGHLNPEDRKLVFDLNLGDHKISYEGEHVVAFKISRSQELECFAGINCKRMVVDGREFISCNEPKTFAFAKIDSPYYSRAYILRFKSIGEYRLPININDWRRPVLAMGKGEEAEILKELSPMEVLELYIDGKTINKDLYLLDLESLR